MKERLRRMWAGVNPTLVVVIMSAALVVVIVSGCSSGLQQASRDPQHMPMKQLPAMAHPPDTPLLKQDGYPSIAPKPIPAGEAGLEIIYPKLAPDQLVVPWGPEDSVFVLGNVTDVSGELTVCGETVPIHPGGGWLAWVGYDHIEIVDQPGLYAEGRYGIVPIVYRAPSQELDMEIVEVRKVLRFRLSDPAEPDAPILFTPMNAVITTQPTEYRDGVIRSSWPGAYDLFPAPGTTLRTDGYKPDSRDRSHRMYRIPLGDGMVGWIKDEFCIVDTISAMPDPPVIHVVHSEVEGRATTIRVPVGDYRMPFRVERTADGLLDLTLYGAKGWTDILHQPVGSEVVSEVRWRQLDPATYRLRAFIDPAYLWGWDVSFEGNSLLWTIIEPPDLDLPAGQPLQGLRIVVDPGHGGWSTGAVGPTGLSEKEVLPQLARVVGATLEEAGATVIYTRTEDVGITVGERVRFAQREAADLVMSLHYNAVGQGTNPNNHHGVSLHYNHRHSLPYAEALYESIREFVGWEGNGIRFQDLAIPRLTFCPSVLIECGFMMHPWEEQLTIDPAFQQATAAGIRAGVIRYVNWLHEQMGTR